MAPTVHRGDARQPRLDSRHQAAVAGNIVVCRALRDAAIHAPICDSRRQAHGA
jgi:hypothetical protein